MDKPIKSNARLDELFKKGQEDGLNHQEKEEFLQLLKEAGVIVRPIECFSDGGSHVH